MKKTSINIALALLVVLSLTILSPESAEKISIFVASKLDRFLLFLEHKVKYHIPSIHLTKEMIKAIPFWAIFILLILAAVNRVMMMRKKEPETEPEFIEPEKKGPVESASREADPAKGGEYNRDVVVRFFLKIFKIQIGALKTAPAKFKPVVSINVWPKRVYELSVHHEGEWISRRLTIGPLGDDGVSKSICYYVIYDDHLVVKIPPEPIIDFQEYLACIKADMMIAKRLSPKECIIPRVSVILGRLVSQGTAKQSPQATEDDYVKRLASNSQYQEYLKIGNSFVFFMDLSRYYFLSSVLTDMHDMENAMPKEILGQAGIIWDAYEFEGRYGRQYAHIGFEMRNIYEEYEREINRLLIQYGVATSLPTYTMKQWFLIHLSGRGRIESEGDLSKAFIEDLNALSRESMIDNRMSIESYRRVIREYIYTSTIARYKAEMGSIITSLIALLMWLGHNRMAMRDLKPDNLLIAGDPEKYPQFLRSPDQFSIGFIDVETAVDFEKESQEDILQPQLGGTPKYATPTHLFPNELIIWVFGDLARILHLQDWHSAVAMIYKVITGGTLYEKTATLLPEIKRMIEASMDDEEQLKTVTEYASRSFWKSAVDEFQEKIEKNRRILNAVHVIILESDKKHFLAQMAHEQKSLSACMIRKMNSQSIFKSKQNKENLIRSSAEKIKEMRTKCETDNGNQLSNKIGIVTFLRELEQLKIQYEKRSGHIQFLKTSGSEIPVATIMEVMFNVVMTAMYMEVWGESADDYNESGQKGDPDASYEATI